MIRLCFRVHPHVCLLISLLLAPVAVNAQTVVTRSISISEILVDNEANGRDESGQITRISPGIRLDYSKAKLDLSLDYKLHLLVYNDIDSDDRFGHIIWQPDIVQVDLYKIHHFDNMARATSLKMLEFNWMSVDLSSLTISVARV